MIERWSSVGAGRGVVPLVVSYYTDGFYEREAFQLARSCQGLGVDYLIERVPDLGAWSKNTSYKPEFLSRLSREFPKRALLWVDADARVLKPLDLFAAEIDQELSYFRTERGGLSGTVYLRRGQRRDSLLAEWRHECLRLEGRNDQQCLDAVWEKGTYSYFPLPETYCWIYDLSPLSTVRGHAADPELHRDVVIEHTQASRWSKRLRAAQVATGVRK